MAVDQKRLEQQIAFCRELDKEKTIGRQTYLADSSRLENDAEHAWHMALMIAVLSEYANEEIDVLKTMTMALLHDVVEIDAGDTYAYDEVNKQTQRERELAAAERIFNLLPEDQAKKFRGYWDEFEEQKTPEAKFARTLDNFQPTMLNDASGGRAWEEHGIAISQVLKRNKRTREGSEALWDYEKEHFLRPSVENGKLLDDVNFKEKSKEL